MLDYDLLKERHDANYRRLQDDSFWEPRARGINWAGVAGLALMAFSVGGVAGWIFTIVAMFR